VLIDHDQQRQGIDIAAADRGVSGPAGGGERGLAGDSSNPVLLWPLRDVLPQREWTTGDLVEDVLA
jgi:hypothetical protein